MDGNGNSLVDEKRSELLRLQDALRGCDEALRVAKTEVSARQSAISAANEAQNAAVLAKWEEMDGEPATKVMDRVYTLGAFGSDQRLKDSLSKAESSVKVLAERRVELCKAIDGMRKEIHHLETRLAIEELQAEWDAWKKAMKASSSRHGRLCRAAEKVQRLDANWTKLAGQMGIRDDFLYLTVGTYLSLDKLGSRGGVPPYSLMDSLTGVFGNPFEEQAHLWRLDQAGQAPQWHDHSAYGISQRRSA